MARGAAGAPVFGVQAHPEVNLEEGERMLRDFAPRFPKMADHPVLGPPRDTGLAATVMKNFLALRKGDVPMAPGGYAG